ncbi:hypothetical protein LCGC14_2654960 [marine sediment metagenome]|uniref:Uncharacterized protein n=1 Tax=marine sediment metagenome TaxID=412755 RepID=A0A0F9C434_9ZZZZ
MATKRRKSRRRTPKIVFRTTSKHDRALSIAGQIGMHILSDPNALRITGTLLETLGKAMQRTADSTQTTATPTPDGVFDLSAFREKKKEPSDG